MDGNGMVRFSLSTFALVRSNNAALSRAQALSFLDFGPLPFVFLGCLVMLLAAQQAESLAHASKQANARTQSLVGQDTTQRTESCL